MPKHVDTWRRIAKDWNLTVIGGPDTGVFTTIHAIDDGVEGVELRHIHANISIGTENTTPPTVMSDYNSGVMGFFLWPVDAAAPTATTLDVERSNKIFARRSWVTQHDIPVKMVNRWPRLYIKPGLELWHAFLMTRQSSAAADIDGVSQLTYVYTER